MRGERREPHSSSPSHHPHHQFKPFKSFKPSKGRDITLPPSFLLPSSFFLPTIHPIRAIQIIHSHPHNPNSYPFESPLSRILLFLLLTCLNHDQQSNKKHHSNSFVFSLNHSYFHSSTLSLSLFSTLHSLTYPTYTHNLIWLILWCTTILLSPNIFLVNHQFVPESLFFIFHVCDQPLIPPPSMS